MVGTPYPDLEIRPNLDINFSIWPSGWQVCQVTEGSRALWGDVVRIPSRDREGADNCAGTLPDGRSSDSKCTTTCHYLSERLIVARMQPPLARYTPHTGYQDINQVRWLDLAALHLPSKRLPSQSHPARIAMRGSIFR